MPYSTFEIPVFIVIGKETSDTIASKIVNRILTCFMTHLGTVGGLLGALFNALNFRSVAS